MQRREILIGAGLPATTFTSYVRSGIIRKVNSGDSSQGPQQYADDSIDRAKLAKRLTQMGFQHGQIVNALDKYGCDEVDQRMASMPVDTFRQWLLMGNRTS